ncbi:hypothetical protein TBLA_0D04610 [Henningerozyma blattae CBS 6284]|uniref:Structural maintenance of chromosomes protein n=1 Tax=Henningerozyma blattae (strain ATCC 34711 / CBS 6284 / DSM 70876 / NBRC 10599 / NRRL Y-10934 / UCD 77-7) TaxID=1071380 RepID=I2H3K5_HENB6|nr:hypothetical protein TBLA_0D04610 [Tetrapisispora blattae CBS 6284]CCH60957.1 hypothetical protein TBLA_0D04610 [Tetrapisispora blattae CBS 6284]
MKVEELIIDGFKSYATRTVISDWDPQFNAITGLNGSGKSNILDAICFVLGISSMTTVRASNLQDLIYKRGQAGVTKASVTIVFDNTDKSNSPIGFNTSPRISVTRQIVIGGTSKYLINGHRAPQQSVLQLFQSVQLNINNPNFLIMQGKITKVLNMKSTEILSLIEEAAGTKMFEDRKEKAQRTMTKKDGKLIENNSILKEEIEPKLNKLKNQKILFLEFQQVQTNLEKFNRIINAYHFKDLNESFIKFENNIQVQKNRVQDLKNLITSTKDELNNLNNDLLELKSKRENNSNNNDTIPSPLQSLQKEESKLLNDISRVQTNLKICLENFKENSTIEKDLKATLPNLKDQLTSKKKLFETKQNNYNQLKIELDKLKNLYSTKEELFSTLQTGISSTGTTDGGYQQQLINQKTLENDTKLSIKKYKMKIDLLNKELINNNPRLEKAKIDHEKDLNNLNIIKQNYDLLNEKLRKIGYDKHLVNKLKTDQNNVQNQIYKLTEKSDFMKKKFNNLDFNYSMPSKDFNPNSVKGVAATLFTINDNAIESASALQVCAGGRLYNVVVDNETTASQLLEKGRLRKRVTIIPLNKIASRRLNENTVNFAKQLAPGKVDLALNLIGYSDELSRAMEFIFGTSLICKDSETAKKVTFHQNIRQRSITLEGDVYDPEGTLSGGSRNNKNSLLLDIQHYNKTCNEIKILEENLRDIKIKLNEQEKIYSASKVIQNDLNLAEHKLAMAQRSVDSNQSTQLIKRNEAISLEIKSCENSITQEQNKLESIQNSIIQIEKDINEFNNDKGSKLKELQQEIKALSKKLSVKENEVENIYDSYQNDQLEIEQLSSDIQDLEEKSIKNLKKLKDVENERIQIESHLDEINHQLSETQLKLEDERKRLFQLDEEINDLTKLLKKKSDDKADYENELKQLQQEFSNYQNNSENIKANIQHILSENPWLEDKSVVESIIEENANINLKEYEAKSKELTETYNEMKRKVNPNIMSMIENVEKKETALKTMIKTIEEDKIKIQETISKLNDYKRETLLKTWEKVTKDFGNIFGDLLPNSSAKLVPSEGKDITEGLEVKVKLGNIWKESLVELSGGQRSLVALSLILALLQFRPAPMYILDEVDAALDLSHTQNIGHLIKTRFKGAQFIVVSLKEGMFTNANRVFRTRFQDGTSVVSVM